MLIVLSLQLLSLVIRCNTLILLKKISRDLMNSSAHTSTRGMVLIDPTIEGATTGPLDTSRWPDSIDSTELSLLKKM